MPCHEQRKLLHTWPHIDVLDLWNGYAHKTALCCACSVDQGCPRREAERGSAHPQG